MRRKHHQIPNLLLDPITVVFLGKVPVQSLRGDIPGDTDRVEADARRLNGPAVDIGGKHLDGEAEIPLRQILLHHDGEGIGFLSCGTAGDPHAQGRALGLALQERRQSLLNEDLEHRRVAKEAGHPDEQLLEQRVEFMRIRQHEPEILFRGLDLMHVHPAFDTPTNRVLFVERKIVPGPIAQEDEDLAQPLNGIRYGKRQQGLR